MANKHESAWLPFEEENIEAQPNGGHQSELPLSDSEKTYEMSKETKHLIQTSNQLIENHRKTIERVRENKKQQQLRKNAEVAKNIQSILDEMGPGSGQSIIKKTYGSPEGRETGRNKTDDDNTDRFENSSSNIGKYDEWLKDH